LSKKFIYTAIIIVVLIGGIVGYNYYQKIFGEAIIKKTILFVNSTDTLNDIENNLVGVSKNQSFLFVAAKKNFLKPKVGRYILKEGMSNNDIVNLLRSGNQTPIKVTFNNQDTLEKLANRIAQQLETDTTSLLNSFKDKSFLSKNNLTEKSILQIFIPNSYEFYWDTSAEKFRNKMLLEYHRFWNKSRLDKAKKINLSIDEVVTLASIVQKETAQKKERPTVAGLYLNRLKKGWPLQADPTIIYSIRELKGQNYVVRRVLTADLEINSPYNTYKNIGLPPTLIAMPDISSVDAVLNSEKHNYMYMCVNVDKLGYHAFAKTLRQHNRNAAKYHRWLNRQGVNR
tara:strand:+ start:1545 stop:2570 length:1026 start_codon:yes stop_codon:yes gene_type:complete